MRTTRDRFRHAVLFELIALAMVTPFGGSVFHGSMSDFGVVALVSTTIAMLWNYGFNVAFDHAMKWRLGHVRKSFRIRVLHSLLFEAGLLCLLVPFIAWYLAATLWQAFLIDVSLSGFYLVYAFAFNWIYDMVYPSEEQKESADIPT